MAAGAPTAAVLWAVESFYGTLQLNARPRKARISSPTSNTSKTTISFPRVRRTGWIRFAQRGNEANHEIQIKSRQEAEEMIDFAEMLLRVIYDYPSRVPAPTT